MRGYRACQYKVAQIIILSVFILVMNYLPFAKRPAEMIAHHKTVFVNKTSALMPVRMVLERKLRYIRDWLFFSPS